eukprot:scaffold3360_cov112-Isochrysis_galbana.AAC.10
MPPVRVHQSKAQQQPVAHRATTARAAHALQASSSSSRRSVLLLLLPARARLGISITISVGPCAHPALRLRRNTQRIAAHINACDLEHHGVLHIVMSTASPSLRRAASPVVAL